MVPVSQDAELLSSNTLVAISTPLEATLDIVAVHGMNVGGNQAHAVNTWTHDSTRMNWISTLLPERFPFARILAFQYNANVAFGTSIAGVEEQASNLLECLKVKRKLNPVRPIIFISHSLGGIIVKQALTTAFREYEAYPTIWTFTYAIFFLAVPHKGSDHTAWGQVLAKVNLAATLQPNNSFLESVRRDSNYSEELNARFSLLHDAYRFYSWIEALPLWPWGIIVPKESATLGLPTKRETCRIPQRDHRTICKFSSADDPEWLEISASIAEAAHVATNSFDYSPTIRRREKMLEPRSSEFKDDQTEPLLQASKEAQSIIDGAYDFLNGDELQRRQRDARDARRSILTLATLLLTLLGPLLNYLRSSALPWSLGNIALVLIIAALPSKEHTLDKALEGQEAEQRIMEIEAWAIERLDDHHYKVLRASHVLKCAISVWEFDDHYDMLALQLSDTYTLREKLQELAVYITQELHERHKSYNRAEAVWHKIEDVRKEASSKDKEDFMITVAERVQKEQYAQEEDPNNDWDDCCVIL